MSNDNKKVKVGSTEDLHLALAAGYEGSQIEIDVSTAIAAARAEGVAEGKAAGAPDVDAVRASAVAGERVRIAAVQKLARPGFEAIVEKGIEDGTAVADVALAIMTAAADRGITLDAIRKDAPQPAPHAKTPSDEKPVAADSWDKAFANTTAPKRM